MGFYGNLSNSARTQFSFDRIFANKLEMMNSKTKDGIYAGRYVLVEYEAETNESSFKRFWMIDGDMYSQVATHVTKMYDSNDFNLEPVNRIIYTGIIANNKILAGEVEDLQLVIVPAYHRIFEYNKETFYIRLMNSMGGYQQITEDEYKAYLRQNKLEEPDNTAEGSQHIHIVNNEIGFGNEKYNKPNQVFKMSPGSVYKTNTEDEYWLAKKDENGNLEWIEVTNSSTTFTKNLMIDKLSYGTERGYDSTVWQKVYRSGEETYIMIADLNTVPPILSMVGDAPCVTPTPPHLDSQSTNANYIFHMTAPWGFRFKSADNRLRVPSISDKGQLGKVGNVLASTDTVFYPSDESALWRGDFFDLTTNEASTGYYSPAANRWIMEREVEEDEEGNEIVKELDLTSESIQVPVAVYYNKDGFNDEKVAYSGDLLDVAIGGRYNKKIAENGWENKDAIHLYPTGRSGRVYANHDTDTDMSTHTDTQEFSMMLPSLGNSIAHLWDLIYGGRETNNTIKTTNERNKDIYWEDAGRAIERNGLRLYHTKPDGNGFTYSDTEANTVAGCINSLHDLMGMIIIDKSEKMTSSAIQSTSNNNIYYFADDNTYRRKHKIFDYTEINYAYYPITLTSDTYAAYMYYYSTDGGKTFLEDNKTTFDANRKYYVKMIPEELSSEEVDLKEYEGGLFYKSKTGIENNEKGIIQYDYIYDDSGQAQKDVEYYKYVSSKVKELTGTYEPGLFYVQESSESSPSAYDFRLEEADAPGGFTYWEINQGEPINANLEDIFQYNENTERYGSEDTGLKDDNGVPILGHRLKYFYRPGLFFIKETDANGEVIGWIPANDNTFDPSLNYYILRFADAENSKKWKFDPEQNKWVFVGGELDLKNVTPYAVDLIQFKQNEYYYIDEEKDGLYKYYTEDDILANETKADDDPEQFHTRPKRFRVLTPEILDEQYRTQFEINDNVGSGAEFYDYYHLEKHIQGSFYTPNLYYYRNYNVNYIKVDKTLMPFNKDETYYIYNEETDKYTQIALTDSYGEQEYYIRAFDWIVDTKAKMTKDRVYYTDIVMQKQDDVYYIPNQYYYKDPVSGEWKLATDINIGQGPYYIVHDFYVIEDKRNVYPIHSSWDSKAVPYIPYPVSIGTRKESYEMQPMVGFAKTLNTVHGLILKINQLLELEDYDTRDRTTLQGTINYLNDILYKFDKLKPKQLVIVDAYGRLVSSDLTTAQPLTAVNEQLSIPDITLDSAQDRWIYTKINGDSLNPLITVRHSFNKQDDTRTISDKNIALTTAANGYNGLGNNNSESDELELYTPIVDSTGHVVGKNKEVVTLPFGFKNLEAQNYSGDESLWSQTGQGPENSDAPASTGEHVRTIRADKTKDTLRFAGGNKWIRFQTSPTSDSSAADTNSGTKTGKDTMNTLTVAHETHNVTTSTSNATLISETSSANETTFTTKEYTFDKAGHVTNVDTKTVKVPFSYGKISGDTGTSVASATFDTVAVNGDNWIKTKAENDIVTLTHTFTAGTDTTSELDVQNVDTIELYTPILDETGHVIAKNTQTVTLPYGYKTFSAGEKSSTATSTNGNMKLVGDDWLAIDIQQDNITFTHNPPIEEEHNDIENVTVAPGESIILTDIFYDNNGHINEVKTHEVVISQEASNLLMTNYTELDEENPEVNITDEDTILDAFAKTRKQITLLDNRLTNKENETYEYNSKTYIDEEINPPIKGEEEATNEIPSEGENESEITIPKKTIEWLFNRVALLEDRLYALEHPSTEEKIEEKL